MKAYARYCYLWSVDFSFLPLDLYYHYLYSVCVHKHKLHRFRLNWVKRLRIFLTILVVPAFYANLKDLRTLYHMHSRIYCGSFDVIYSVKCNLFLSRVELAPIFALLYSCSILDVVLFLPTSMCDSETLICIVEFDLRFHKRSLRAHMSIRYRKSIIGDSETKLSLL